MKKKPELL